MKTDHMNTTLSKKNMGFSLIEVMIAMVIFSIGILAVGSMQLSSSKNNTTGNITTQATMLARQKIEELRVVQDLNDIVFSNDEVGPYERSWGSEDSCSDDFCQIWVEVRSKRWPADRKVRLKTFIRGK
jgi:type IV pilus modification protein PilV